MNSKEKRLVNLRRLVDQEENGNAAELAKKIGTDPNYIYQILSPKAKRNVGDKLARRIESAYSKKPGWMDEIEEEIKLDRDILAKTIARVDKEIAKAGVEATERDRAVLYALFYEHMQDNINISDDELVRLIEARMM